MIDQCAICDGDVCQHGLCRHTGDPWTDGCKGSYGEDGYQCSSCAEAQQEAEFTAYWEGSTPDYVYENMARLENAKR